MAWCLATCWPGSCKIESDSVVSGARRSKGFAGEKTFYFVAQFSKPIQHADLNVDGKHVDGKAAQGKLVWAGLDFGNLGGEPLVVKVGLSAVSVEGAMRESQGRGPRGNWFRPGGLRCQGRLGAAALRIDAHFDRQEIARRSTPRCTIRNCVLYLFCDVDGAFWGPDGKSHRPEGFPYYTSFSLWDTFRAEHPLLILTAPDALAT